MLNQARHLRITPSFFPDLSPSTDESQAMDKEFRRHYIERSLPITRIVLGLGILFAVAICILDAFMMPREFSEEVIPLRVLTMLMPLVAVLGVTFLFNDRYWLPRAVAFVALLIGVATIVAGAVSQHGSEQAVFWSVVYITFSAYLVLGLTLQQSIAVGWPTFFAYLLLGVVFDALPQSLSYGAVYLGFLNLIGTYASYLLERNAREIFDDKRELLRLARTDELTGLFNRRTFDEHLRQIWKQARRDDKHIAVVVADIDHFKLYNDCYGHKKGDECIKAVADVLAESASRPLDLVARYGGEEYVIVLYNPTMSFLESFTRSLCHKIIDLDIEHKAAEATPSISLSIGAAIAEASGTVTAEQLVRQADDALYEAKNQGRNQAITYRTEWGQQTTANLAAVLL